MTVLHLDVYTSPERTLPNGGLFSPTTATLVLGEREAVLADTGYFAEDVEEISRRIRESGRTLTAVYITHAHPDHYFGLDRLLEAHPQARAVALPHVAADIETGLESDRAQWREFFGGKALDNTTVPEPLDGDTLTVDGQPLRAIAVGQGDVPRNTALHIPSLQAVIAGDIIYNGVNPFLAASGPEQWRAWIDSIGRIAELSPRIVVAGHKRPELPDDDPAATLEGTRGYIRDFIEELEASEGPRELVARMQRRYPDHANPSALIMSAVTAFKRTRSGNA
ncbi:MBL fold metallo-hydrolase [Actinomadura keratinilytica]|uniref:MBL fold metallo-hydrolase n=1 Tax=Actinomadura keratinilytica TaxID=547461 RepID=A0ABP7Z5L8_9ACTN